MTGPAGGICDNNALIRKGEVKVLMPTMSILLALTMAPPAASTVGLNFYPSFGLDSIWDDGLAEVAHYEAHQKVYGVDRSFQTTLITVKEEFDAITAVKADAPYEGRRIITVLKLNILSWIPTESYPYSYMTSVFARRDDTRILVKAVSSSQEWCGTTFKEVVTWDGLPRLQFHSYFDAQADGMHPIALDAGALLEDQLFLVMRGALPAAGEPTRHPIHESLIGNSVPRAPVVRLLTLVNAGGESLATPAGRFETNRYDLHDGRLTDAPLLSYWIEDGARRALVKFSAADGRSLLLKEISRRNYWSR